MRLSVLKTPFATNRLSKTVKTLTDQYLLRSEDGGRTYLSNHTPRSEQRDSQNRTSNDAGWSHWRNPAKKPWSLSWPYAPRFNTESNQTWMFFWAIYSLFRRHSTTATETKEMCCYLVCQKHWRGTWYLHIAFWNGSNEWNMKVIYTKHCDVTFLVLFKWIQYDVAD